MRELALEALEDILVGCAILGTGGGGSLEAGLKMVRADAAAGKVVRLASADELPGDALVVSPYFAGSISPLTPEQVAAYEGLPRVGELESIIAARALAAYLGKEIGAVISTELGGGNTASALTSAANLGVPVVDGDPAGRSVPELTHSTFFINGVSIAPMGLANQFGDAAVLTRVVNDFRAEALVRAMAVASQNKIGVADHPLPAKELPGKVIEGAISRAEKIGAALRRAKGAGAGGAEAAEAVRQAGEGFHLFRGTITRAWWKDEAGFTLGEIEIRGSGPDSGSAYRISYKNEHMAAWRDGAIDVTVPDLIVVLDGQTGDPVINPGAREGQAVMVIGFPAPAAWRTPRGLELFGPAYAGVSSPYVPIERRGRPA